MNIILVGASGHMGQEVKNLSKSKNDIKSVDGKPIKINIIGKVDIDNGFNKIKISKGKINGKKVDCIIDFSNHKGTNALCNFAVKHNLPTIIATTGQNATEEKKILSTSTKIPLFYSSNYSMGIALLVRLAQQSALIMKNADIEIVEAHHNRKLDAPSGTAITLAEAIKQVKPKSKIVSGRSGNKKRSVNEIGVNSIRMGNIVGTHEVILNSGNESITLKHTAYSREIFAEGAVVAAGFLIDKKPGLYAMSDMIESYV